MFKNRECSLLFLVDYPRIFLKVFSLQRAWTRYFGSNWLECNDKFVMSRDTSYPRCFSLTKLSSTGFSSRFQCACNTNKISLIYNKYTLIILLGSMLSIVSTRYHVCLQNSTQNAQAIPSICWIDKNESCKIPPQCATTLPNFQVKVDWSIYNQWAAISDLDRVTNKSGNAIVQMASELIILLASPLTVLLDPTIVSYFLSTYSIHIDVDWVLTFEISFYRYLALPWQWC